MSFLDKAKEKAKDLATQAKEKVDDLKETRKVDDLLTELGRITYRQHTGRGDGADVTETEGLVSRLREMEDAGAEVIPQPATAGDSTGTSSPGAASTGAASTGAAATGSASSEPAEHPAWEPPTATPPMPTTDPDETSAPLP